MDHTYLIYVRNRVCLHLVNLRICKLQKFANCKLTNLQICEVLPGAGRPAARLNNSPAPHAQIVFFFIPEFTTEFAATLVTTCRPLPN